MPKFQLAKKLLAVGMSLSLAAGLFTGALAVSAADESDVLFEENFDGLTQLSSDWKENLEYKDGKISVEDGALIIDGTGDGYNCSGVVYLGSELKDKGDYTLEYDYTPLAAFNNDTSRWASGMYRVSGTTPDNTGHYTPYYHFTTRLNASRASGGAELTARVRNGGWKTYVNIPAPSDMELNKTYHMKIICKGGSIQEYIGNEAVIAYELDEKAADYIATGGIGFQTAGLKIKIDNVRVTETKEMPVIKTPGVYNVYEPETALKMAPTVVLDVKTKADYDKLTGTKLPATAIFHLDAALNVVDQSGGTIATLAQALEKTGDNVIPGFYLSDKSAITALKNYTDAAKIIDATIFSADAAVLTEAHKAMDKLRTALDFKLTTKVDQAKLDEMIALANKTPAKIMVMDNQYVTKQDLEYMQIRMMTVWTRGDYDAEGTYSQVVKGPDGIVTGDFLQVFDCYKTFTEANSIIRTPFTVGHRGYPNLYPENTMLSMEKSVEAGATAVEIDIHMTTDGVIVLCHDETVDRTTNGTGNITKMTWDQLKDLKCKRASGALTDEGIPRLEQFLEFLQKNPHVVAYVELKDGNTAIVEPFKKMVAEYGVTNQICTISFYYTQVAKMRELMPETSIGYLGGSSNGSTADKLTMMINSNFPTESTWHPNMSFSDSAILEAAKHRGISLHLWTYNGMAAFNAAVRQGVQSLTSNSSEWLTDMYSYLEAKDSYTLKANIASEVAATGVALNGKTEGLACKIVRIGGDDITFTSYDNGTVAADKEGTARVLLCYEKKTFDGNYHIYSTPVTVTVEQGAATPTEPPKTEPSESTPTTAPSQVESPAIPGVIREIDFSINNASAWMVRDMKSEVNRDVYSIYAQYPELRVSNDEDGNLVILRAPFSANPWARTYTASFKNEVNLVDNKLYFDFTAECAWNMNLVLNDSGNALNSRNSINLATYINQEVNGTTIGYLEDAPAGVYQGVLDIKKVYEDAVAKGNIDAGLIAEDGSAVVGCLQIWSVSGAEDADKLIIKDIFVGRADTSSSNPSTDPSGDPSTDPSSDPSTDPSADPSVDPSADPSSDPSADPSAAPTTKPSQNNNPNTGDNTALAVMGVLLLAVSAGALVLTTKKLKSR
ncbi:MAG: hypothetical protein HFJ80_08115 [Clostridiales bacterium]|nr:hypothetical protein [Clostridiales bacterium]